jgi:hypothetical protein
VKYPTVSHTHGVSIFRTIGRYIDKYHTYSYKQREKHKKKTSNLDSKGKLFPNKHLLVILKWVDGTF